MTNNPCPQCGAPLKQIPAGVSKKTGNPYDAFVVCSMDCGWKPPKANGKPYSAPKPAQPPYTPQSDNQSRVEQNIEKAQARKEDSVLYFASVREAGNYMLVMFNPQLREEGISHDEYMAEFSRVQGEFYEQFKHSPQR